ncbi:hypothetical protein BC828DRAFT_393291 [Blastocladiella britannica]|nr:hypothetical protein BC828DRAFT_393291 [Blastocladiella britannica]
MLATRPPPTTTVAIRAALPAQLLAHLRAATLHMLLAVLPAPLAALLTTNLGSAVDAVLAALAAALSVSLLHRRVVPFVAQRLLTASGMSVRALAMRDARPTSVTTTLTAFLAVPGPPLPVVMLARKPMRVTYKGATVAWATIAGAVAIPPGGGLVEMEAVMSLVDLDDSNVGAGMDTKMKKKRIDGGGGGGGLTRIQRAFAGFCRDLVLAEGEVGFEMAGEGVEVRVLGGMLAVPGLRLEKSVSLPGMRGLSEMSIGRVQLIDSSLTTLTLECECTIVNPAPVTMDSGTVHFAMTTPELVDARSLHDSPVLATIAIHDLVLRPGPNTVTAVCTMVRPHPATMPSSAACAAGLQVLSQHLMGGYTPVVVFGTGADCAYLAPAIRAVIVHTELPPIADPPPPLLVRTDMMLSRASLLAQAVPARLTMSNPFPLGMTVTRMKGTAYLSRALIGDGTAGSASAVTESPRVPMGLIDATVMLYIPGLSTVTPDEPVTMGLQLGIAQLAAVAGSGGELEVDVDCEIDCRVGLCVLSGVAYSQDRVKIVIGF